MLENALKLNIEAYRAGYRHASVVDSKVLVPTWLFHMLCQREGIEKTHELCKQVDDWGRE